MWAMHCPSDVAALRLGLALELVLLAERVQVADDASLGSEAERVSSTATTNNAHTARASADGARIRKAAASPSTGG